MEIGKMLPLHFNQDELEGERSKWEKLFIIF